MIRSDFHCHTLYCDGKDSPEDMVRSALEKGLAAVGISGHSYAPFDPGCPGMTPENEAKYRRQISKLKKKYEGQIRIFCGLEQDIFSPAPVKPFDYSIGSVHYLKTRDGYISVDDTIDILRRLRDGCFGGDIYALCSAYYETVSSVCKVTGCDIIGHFDLISKFNEDGSLFDAQDPRYRSAWMSAADELLKADVPFEVNTGAMSRGYRTEPYPSQEIIRYISGKGGRFVLSSDAHRKEDLTFGFERALEILNGLGIEPVDPLDLIENK